jgi:septum site-determining protein MinD
MYVLAGGKGGVGRTTTALNTGIALERAGYNTVLVDGDVAMTGLTDLLNPDAESGVHGILAGTDSINDAVADGPEGLTIVPGDTAPAAVADVDESRFGRIVEPLAAAHDVVLVDTGPGVRPVHRDAYARADGTFLVTTPDEQAIAAAGRTADIVAAAGGDVAGAVVTMTDEAGAADAVDRLDTDTLAVVPESPTIAAGTPTLDADDDAAGGFEQLATAIGSLADGEDVDPVTVGPASEPTEDSATAEGSEVEETGGTDSDGGAVAATGDDSADGTDADSDGVTTAATTVVTDDRETTEETAAGSEPTGVDGDDALDKLFDDDYTSDDPDVNFGTRLADLPKRISDASSAEAVVERLREAASTRNGDNPLQTLRERLSREDEDPEDVDLETRLQERETRIEPSGDTDEDPLDKLFTDEN